MEKVKVAVIGCGTIANAQHLPTLKKIPEAEIAYCVDLIPERAQKAAETYGGKPLTDYKEILSDKSLKGVLVCTPNYAHAPIAMDCLRAGLGVFCEKPITVNYALAKKMADTAQTAGRILNIGVCNRYNSTVEKVKESIESGLLGEVYHIYCSFRSFRSIPGLGGPFTTSSHSGGGVLIDWGVHFLDLILYCTGIPKVRSVSTDCYAKLGKDIPAYKYINMWAGPPIPDGVNDVEEFVTGHIRTDGPTISMNGAWAQNINEKEMFIDFLGTKGGIRMNYGGDYTLYTEIGGDLSTVKPDYVMADMFLREDTDFIHSLKTGNKSRNNVEYVLETALIMDKIYESAKLRKEVLL